MTIWFEFKFEYGRVATRKDGRSKKQTCSPEPAEEKRLPAAGVARLPCQITSRTHMADSVVISSRDLARLRETARGENKATNARAQKNAELKALSEARYSTWDNTLEGVRRKKEEDRAKRHLEVEVRHRANFLCIISLSARCVEFVYFFSCAP